MVHAVRPLTLVYVGKLGGLYMTAAILQFFSFVKQLVPRSRFEIWTQSDPGPLGKQLEDHGLAAETLVGCSAPAELLLRLGSRCDAAVSFIRPCVSKLASSPTKIPEYLAAGLPVVANRGIGDMDELIAREGVGARAAQAIAERAVSDGYDDMRRLYLWALVFRFGAGMLGWLLTLLVNIPFLQDAFYYEETGAGIARDWLAGRSSEWLSWAMTVDRAPWLLPTVIGGFYWLSGGLRLVPLLLLGISSVTAFTPVLTYLIAREMGLTRSGANFAGGLVAFSPAFAFWSGGFYKEGLVLLLLNLSMYQVLRLQRGWKWDSMFILLGCLFGLFGLRFYLAAMLSAIVLVGLLLGRSKAGDGALTMLRQAVILAGFN